MFEGGGHEIFLWENQSWGFSNSDNSGGNEEKSNSETPKVNDKQVAVASGKKMCENNNGKGISGEGNEEKGGGGGGGGGGDSDHIWTERERRKKMRNMFSNLHALLPQLPPKVDKSSIVDEAVNYIKVLQNTLQKLQKQKLERLQGATSTINYNNPSIISTQNLSVLDSSREAFLVDQGSSSNFGMITSRNSLSVPQFPTMFQTWTSPNVILNVSGDDGHISVCSAKKPGLLTAICYVLEKYKLEVVSAQVSSDQNRNMYMIHIHHARRGADQNPEIFPVEEIFKQAAGEIMFWTTS